LANEGIIVESRTINNRLLKQDLKSHRFRKKPLFNTENEAGEISVGCSLQQIGRQRIGPK